MAMITVAEAAKRLSVSQCGDEEAKHGDGQRVVAGQRPM
jgi:hypothetical protein